MDDFGRYPTRIFIDRPSRSLKYEAVYFHEPVDGHEAEREVGSWFSYYSQIGPHMSLDWMSLVEYFYTLK